jgi:thiosulfate/3-mercaptopyruvate sulfurtransferase
LLLGKLGINAADTIVIYDEKAECDAARLWWVLKFYGHKNVKLLNGGLTTWNALGNELSIDAAISDTTAYRFQLQPDSSILALLGAIELMPDSDLLLLDTRGTDEYSGEFHKSGAAYPGHIKGAINLDWAVAVDYDGTQKFLSAQELKARYAAIGIDGTKPVITYCHSGVRSAHTLFVLTELLGYRNIKNYDGSWVEWSHRFSQ